MIKKEINMGTLNIVVKSSMLTSNLVTTNIYHSILKTKK